VLVAGRALLLHPILLDGLREALPPSLPLRSGQLQAHTTAAQLAHAGRLSSTPSTVPATTR
jgi:hypothetical protein